MVKSGHKIFAVTSVDLSWRMYISIDWMTRIQNRAPIIFTRFPLWVPTCFVKWVPGFHYLLHNRIPPNMTGYGMRTDRRKVGTGLGSLIKTFTQIARTLGSAVSTHKYIRAQFLTVPALSFSCTYCTYYQFNHCGLWLHRASYNFAIIGLGNGLVTLWGGIYCRSPEGNSTEIAEAQPILM